LEDLLRLAAEPDQPLMTGAVRLTTKFDLPPGDGEIVDRLRLDGKFGIGAAQFAIAEVRQKLEGLSRRGQGKPEDEDAGSEVSELKGSFLLRDGQITFRDLTFGVTGATVELAGTYGLRDEKLDFRGTLCASQAVASDDRLQVVPAETVRSLLPQEWRNRAAN
jgi:hypothetical protein